MAFEVAMVPIAAIVLVIIVVIAWKVFKFALKKISAVVQGIISLAIIALAVSGQAGIDPVWGSLVGLGILFGAISNFLG